MKKILLCLTLFTLSLFLCSCSKKQEKPEPKYPVKVAEAIQKDVPVFIEVIGNITSPQLVIIRPQVGGLITDTYVQQGQFVKKGDPLFKIDPRPYQAALDRAEANLARDQAALEFNKSKFERYQNLVTKDYVTKVDYELYKSNVETSASQVLFDKADIATAKINLEWTTPFAPISGKISQFTVDVGNIVQANDPNAITDLRQMDPIEVTFNITQKDYIRYQEASKSAPLNVAVFLPEKMDESREGKIYFVDNHIDPATGTIQFKAEIPNEDQFLWPGEFVRVHILLKTMPNAILVPEEAPRLGQKGYFLFVYNPDSSTVALRPVEKGQTVDGYTVITKGIKPGEKVVTEGQINLKNGAKVFFPDEAEKGANAQESVQ